MRQLLFGAAAIALLAALAAAPQPAPEKEAPRFQPVEIVSTVDPIYPANVVTWGTVVLQVSVDEEGALEAIKVLRDAPPFTDVAQRAVKQWKFRPARLEGQAVRSSIIAVFSFPPRPVG